MAFAAAEQRVIWFLCGGRVEFVCDLLGLSTISSGLFGVSDSESGSVSDSEWDKETEFSLYVSESESSDSTRKDFHWLTWTT